MSLAIDVLNTEHETFCRLLDQLSAQLGACRDGGSPDYRQMMTVMEQLMPGSDRYHGHYRKENLLFDQFGRRRNRPLLVLDALAQQRRRVGAYRVEFASLLCAAINGEGPLPERASLEAAMQSYNTAFRAQIAYEEHVLFPVLSTLAGDTAGVH